MNTLIILGIITLCICNLAVLGLLTILILDNRNKINIRTGSKGPHDQESGPAQSPIDEEELRRQKKEYLDSEKAFQEMMNFNAYKAYGMQSPSED